MAACCAGRPHRERERELARPCLVMPAHFTWRAPAELGFYDGPAFAVEGDFERERTAARGESVAKGLR